MTQHSQLELDKFPDLIEKFNEMVDKVDLNIASDAYTWYQTVAFYKGLLMDSGVYFLRDSATGHVKIGWSKNITKRVEQLKRAAKFIGKECTLELIQVFRCVPELGEKLEQIVHNDLWHSHYSGEWYQLNADDLEWILDQGAMLDIIENCVRLNKEILCRKYLLKHSPKALMQDLPFGISLTWDRKLEILMDCAKFQTANHDFVKQLQDPLIIQLSPEVLTPRDHFQKAKREKADSNRSC